MIQSKLLELIDDSLVEVAQFKWGKIISEVGIDSLQIPIEYVSLMRICFQLAYQEGHSDMLMHIKELHDLDQHYLAEYLGKVGGESEWKH